MSPTGRVVVGTVVTRQFLPMARVMLSSLRAVHPDLPLVLVAADRGVFDGLRPDDTFDVIDIEAVGIPRLDEMRERYSLAQLVIATKGFMLRELLRRGYARAVFLDADIEVYAPIDPLLSPPAGAQILLTPHLLSPLWDCARHARERNILQSGVFNGGAIGVCDGDQSRRFLDWWCDRLHTDCRHDLAAGLHNDQRWLDLVPSYFSATHVVRSPGCNVAYWNLPERRVDFTGGQIRVNGEPLRFFHFSGFDPAMPDAVTRYSTRLRMSDLGPAAALFQRFAAAVTQQERLTDILV